MSPKPQIDATQLGELIRDIGDALAQGLPEDASFVLVVAHGGDVFADGRIDEGETIASFVGDALDGCDDEAGKAHGSAFPYERNGHTSYQVRWLASVVEVIRVS